MNIPDLFKDFSGREDELRRIKRFATFTRFCYRSDLWEHERRVYILVRDLSPIARRTLQKFNAKKAQTLALVHDDTEIITGDVNLAEKRRMTKAALKKVAENETEAIEVLAGRFPKTINGFSYKKLLYHALHKDCIEAQVVSYADKVDAMCEAAHEVYGGNILALEPLLFYPRILGRFTDTFPRLAPFLAYADSPLTNFDWNITMEDITDGRRVRHFNKPHSKKSIREKTIFSPYNRWRELILAHLGKEGERFLTTRRDQ